MKGSECASCDISKGNIHFMDSKGYDFIIMVKGMKNLVREVVMSVQGTFILLNVRNWSRTST